MYHGAETEVSAYVEPGLKSGPTLEGRVFFFFSNKLGWARSIALSLVGTVALLLVIRACNTPAQAYTTLGPQAAPLRAQFNADAGKTRILILPAPN